MTHIAHDDDTTRDDLGLLLVTRDDAAGRPSEFAEIIFFASVSNVIGPFATGDVRCLVRAEEVGRRPLDDELRHDLRQQLFGQWLSDKAAG